MKKETAMDDLQIIKQELDWFERVLDTRLTLYFGHESPIDSIWDIQPPVYVGTNTYYERFIQHYEASAAERLIVMLSMVPFVKPQLLDVLTVKNATYDKGFTEFGGLKGSTHGGFLPTAETALFLLAGSDLDQRYHIMEIFDSQHYLVRHHIIELHDPGPNEPWLSGMLIIAQDQLQCMLTGKNHRPHFSRNFPAKLITTEMDWQELVLPEETLAHIEEIPVWIKHHRTLLYDWGLNRRLKPGFKSLFYGPPGTGKTLVACLIGKRCNMDVYRVDLSAVVSKYIGETEKNMEKIFNMAENKNWILFFDEADALFGKRTGVNNSHDRYANQETAYLLQRIEDFSGVIVLATNLKTNIDEAFARRFQSLIYFPMPPQEQRLRLWQQSFSTKSVLEESIDLPQLARKHELTGGMILNVIRYCSLMSLKRNENMIRLADTEKGIKRELIKEGRML